VETCILASTRTNDLVLDPFIGSGTTAAMAQKLGRHYVGIDCNEHYCALAIARVQEVQPALGLV